MRALRAKFAELFGEASLAGNRTWLVRVRLEDANYSLGLRHSFPVHHDLYLVGCCKQIADKRISGIVLKKRRMNGLRSLNCCK